MIAVVLISNDGASGPLRGLMDRLASVGVPVAIVSGVDAAAATSRRQEAPPALLLDLRAASAGEAEDVRAAGELIERTLAALPYALPIVVAAGPTLQFVIGCVRAGAADVIDILVEGTAAVRAVVQRIAQRQETRRRELATIEEQRALVEELLKDLVRTERRAIDNEEAIVARTRSAGNIAALAEARAPAVLLVESERRFADDLANALEDAGVATFAYLSGEEALREAGRLAETCGLDLAIVAAQLPGMDGLETVRRLRERVGGLPAFLIVSEPGERAAEEAAHGVVGYLAKPLADLDEAIAQVVALARESADKTREALYLQRIKERHERVLTRYRTVTRPP